MSHPFTPTPYVYDPDKPIRARPIRAILDRSVPDVKLRGEELSEPVLWQGRQWAVTPHGIEKRDGTYTIESKILYKNHDEPWTARYYGSGWLAHMADKEWIDLPDFAAALGVAMIVFFDGKGGHR